MSPDPDARAPAALLALALAGDVRALGRLLSLVEGGATQPARSPAGAPADPGWVVGVTGAAGAGKSSLVGALVDHLRALDQRVAVVAVDPSSPVSGGAILGDRVRFQHRATDPGVFVRSMSSRGRTGGLSRAAGAAARVLGAAGWPLVLVETVGAGQSEVDVATTADTVLVVVTPGWGDALQVAKAGVLEVADVLVVNKADRPGAGQAVRDLQEGVHLGEAGDWAVPVLTTVATTGEGVAELWAAVESHRAHLDGGGRHAARRHAQAAAQIRRHAADSAAAGALALCRGPEFDRLVAEVAAGTVDASTAAALIAGP